MFTGWTKPVAPPVHGMTPGGIPMRPHKDFAEAEKIARPTGPPPKPSDLKSSPKDEMYKSITRLTNELTKMIEFINNPVKVVNPL